jgi:hypothetical protein
MASMECVKCQITQHCTVSDLATRSITYLVDHEVELKVWREVNARVHDVVWRQIRDEIYEIR